jgi:hypothetical protein
MIRRSDYMEKKYVKIFKCRGCDRNIIKNDVDLSAVEEWTLSETFKSKCETAEVSGGSRLSGQNKFLLHRCDPENLCVCDFIGWKEIEAKND